jgi:hypothetical protein
MRVDDAIALLISANNARAIAIRTIRRAEEDIKRAQTILFELEDDTIKPGKTLVVDGYSLHRTTKITRRKIDNAMLLNEWESLPKKVRDRFDTVFVGTVADLEELLGPEGAVPFLRQPPGDETVVVREIRQEPKEKQERVEFGP